jgi:hypothetical protein
MGSEVGSTHREPHRIWPARHEAWHVPLAQTKPVTHALPAFGPWQSPVAPQKFGSILGLTQVGVPLTEQRTSPEPHDELHAPDEHTFPAEHVVPGVPASPTPQPAVAPQNWLLLSGSMQSPLHATSPGGHVIPHTPPAHVCPLPHCVPAEPLPPTPHPPVAPQNWLSDVGSTHLPLQSTCPGWQETWHCPLEQTCPWPQALPHLPQLVLSVCVFVQKAPASVVHVVSWPHENAHVPLAQTCPVAHVFPQSPQLAGSVDGLMHEPPHVLLGALQKSEHCPELQTWPGWHALPHLPQLSKSELRSAQVPAPQSV